MIVECARMASSSVRKRRSARTDFSSVQGFANPCALRAPTTSKFFGYTPSEKFERGSSGKPVAWRNGLPQDRQLRTDGLFIRAQATIRADGFRPRSIATLQQQGAI
jgi:hypothetical protein